MEKSQTNLKILCLVVLKYKIHWLNSLSQRCLLLHNYLHSDPSSRCRVLTIGAHCQLSALSEQTAVASPSSLCHDELLWAGEEQHTGLAHSDGVNSEASLWWYREYHAIPQLTVTASSLWLLAKKTISLSNLQPLAQVLFHSHQWDA